MSSPRKLATDLEGVAQVPTSLQERKMTERPERIPERILRRKIFVMAGLLSLVSIVVGVHATVRLGETNEWLTKSLGEARLLVTAVDAARNAQVHFKKQVQEWKDVLLRGGDSALFAKHFQAFVDEENAVKTLGGKLQDLLAELEMPSTLVTSFLEAHGELGKRYRDAIKLYDGKKPETAFTVDGTIRGIDREATDRLDTVVRDMESKWDARIEAYTQESIAEMRRHSHFNESLIILVGCGVVIALFFSLAILRDFRASP